jgi:hypothetical protein
MSTLRTLGQLSTRMSFRRRMEYKTPSPTSVISTVSFPKDDDDDIFQSTQQHQHQHQRRYYHQTARQEFLYPAIIIISALSYVAYRKFNGEPIKPKSASDAQDEYRKMEEDRMKRNLKDKEGMNKKEDDK